MAPRIRPKAQGQNSSQPPIGRSSLMSSRYGRTPGGMVAIQEAAESAGPGRDWTCDGLVMRLKCGMCPPNVKANDKPAGDKEIELTEPGGKVRLYVEAPLAAAAHILGGEAQGHYLLHVMRAK